MKTFRSALAVGLMSGTSLDGIDVALLSTDGIAQIDRNAWLTIPYTPELRDRLREVVHGRGDVNTVERELTKAHVEAVSALLHCAKISSRDVNVIGFHGHTIRHEPRKKITFHFATNISSSEVKG